MLAQEKVGINSLWMNLGQLLIVIWNTEKVKFLQERSRRTRQEPDTTWPEVGLEEFR